ncbi:MAG: efflux RND transporter permease subunit, partial [Gemmatimonadales bacterium]
MSAMMVLYLRGTTINTMVLAGFVAALGAVVDDAIVDIENIVRGLRQDRREGRKTPIGGIILEASLEVRNAIVVATLICVVAVLPVFLMRGLSGTFFQPLAFAYGLALLASMVVALTVTPAMSFILLRNVPLEQREFPLIRWLQRGYQAALSGVVDAPLPAYLTVGVIVLAGLVDHYRATVGFAVEKTDTGFVADVDYTSPVFDSDGLTAAFPVSLELKYAAAIAAHAKYRTDGLSFVVEYNGVLDTTDVVELDDNG